MGFGNCKAKRKKGPEEVVGVKNVKKIINDDK